MVEEIKLIEELRKITNLQLVDLYKEIKPLKSSIKCIIKFYLSTGRFPSVIEDDTLKKIDFNFTDYFNKENKMRYKEEEKEFAELKKLSILDLAGLNKAIEPLKSSIKYITKFYLAKKRFPNEYEDEILQESGWFFLGNDLLVCPVVKTVNMTTKDLSDIVKEKQELESDIKVLIDKFARKYEVRHINLSSSFKYQKSNIGCTVLTRSEIKLEIYTLI